jgi:hypothetical protein
MRHRHTRRFTVRSTVRRASRAAFRVRWRAPDDLGAALSSFRRAIRAHARLARLAPQFFDAVTIERERRESEARRSWMAIWKPALDKVYGPESQPSDPPAALPRLPSRRTQPAVDRELAFLNVCLSSGGTALEQHRLRHPHALIDFSRLARLIEIASDLGRLACGFDSGLADPQPDNHDAAWADLKRAYGHLSSPASSGPGSPLPLSARESNPASDFAPVQSTGASSSAEVHPPKDNLRSPPADLAPCPAAPPRQAPHRCDAWSRWARQMRRSGGTGYS